MASLLDLLNGGLGGLLGGMLNGQTYYPDIAGQMGSPQPMQGMSGMQAPRMPLPAQMAAPSPQPPQQAPQAPQDGPGFGDRLTAGTQGFFNAGSPMQALGNLIGGLSTGQRSDPQGMLQQQQQATLKALMASGVPGPIAQAATLNPEILKTISPAYFDTKPQLQETGTDPFSGDKKFGVYRPNQGTLTPVGGQPAEANTNGLGSFDAALKNGVTGEALYAHLPPTMAGTVKAMIEGRLPPPSTIAMRSPATLALINAANAIDPTFDATTWKTRNTFNTQLGSASPASVGGQKTLMGTSLGHLAELADAATAMNNSNGMGIAPLGKAINYGSQVFTDQAAKANKLNETVARFSGEVGKLYSGNSGGGVHEREETRNRFSPNMTSAELASALEASRDLISSKLQALENQRDEVYGPNSSNRVDFLGKSGHAAIEKINQAIEKLKGGGSAAPAQGGVVRWERGPDGVPRQVQ